MALTHRSMAALLLLTMIVPAAISAAGPNMIGYQGRVMSNGSPVADDTYPASFSLYTAAVAGTLLWSESSSITTTSGLFSHILGSTVPIHDSIFPRVGEVWLQITVNGQVQSPRTQIVSTGYALSVSTVDGAVGGEVWGDLALSGELLLPSTSPDLPSVRTFVDAVHGGTLLMRTGDGQNPTIEMYSSATPTSGNIHLFGPSGVTGLGLWGSGGEQNPAIYGLGDSSSFYITTGRSGDNAVMFPVASIDAVEMFNEPGAASLYSTSMLTMDGSVQSLAAKSLAAPSTGYALIVATAQVNISHANGAQSVASFGISTSTSTFPASQNTTLSLPSTLPSGLYNFPVTVSAMFPVGSGSTAFYFLGDENSGAYTIYDRTLSVLFVPTTYGGVPTPTPPSVENKAQVSRAGGQDPEVERLYSQQTDEARIQSELSEMKARIDELNRMLAAKGLVSEMPE